MPKQTTEYFIEQANQIHGEGTFDYSLTEYVDSKTKVKIICKNGHMFEMLPSNHNKKYGCPICSGKFIHTFDDYVYRLKQLFGDLYKYGELIKRNINGNIKTYITIKCKKHGWKTCRIDHALSGNICKECGSETTGNKLKSNKNEFIEKANKIHGEGIFNYDLVEYVNNITQIEIICSAGHLFKQRPSDHLAKKGCPICGNINAANKTRFTTEEFIEKANKIHGVGTFDYGLVEYMGIYNKVLIKCNNGHVFEQRPVDHLSYCGCKECKMSSGELKVSIILKELGINYKFQYTDINCRHKNPLPFDFGLFVNDKLLIIEFHGKQHYEIVNWVSNKEESKLIFKETLFRDNIKLNFCKDKNIPLLTIKYTETNIKELIVDFIENNK